MKDIQMRELTRVLKFIEAIGCQYAVVTDDGEILSNGLEVKPPRVKAPRAFHYGEVRGFITQQIKLDAEIGTVQEIPAGKYGTERIRSGVCSLLSERWGKDTYTTNITEHTVEVLRTA